MARVRVPRADLGRLLRQCIEALVGDEEEGRLRQRIVVHACLHKHDDILGMVHDVQSQMPSLDDQVGGTIRHQVLAPDEHELMRRSWPCW